MQIALKPLWRYRPAIVKHFRALLCLFFNIDPAGGFVIGDPYLTNLAHILTNKRFVRRHKPSVLRRIVPSPKVIKTGFGIAFLAGEVQGAGVAAGSAGCLGITERQAGDSFARAAAHGAPCPFGPQPIGMVKTRRATVTVGSQVSPTRIEFSAAALWHVGDEMTGQI